MIVSEIDLNLVLDNEMYARMWNTATLTKIIILGEDIAVAARASTLFGVPCETLAPPFHNTIHWSFETNFQLQQLPLNFNEPSCDSTTFQNSFLLIESFPHVFVSLRMAGYSTLLNKL